MLHAGPGVEAAPHGLPVAHQDRAHQRIGAGLGVALAGQIQRLAQIPGVSFLFGGVHFSKREAMNFSASNGSRSSAFSPMPT